jgi:hypothetical protein
MRDHLQAIEPFVINYAADTAEIYWLAGDTDKAVAMLQPFRPGRALELALVEASAGHYREAAAAQLEMPATNYPPGMLEAAAKTLEGAPVKAAAPAALPRLGNMSFAYMHVGAPESVLEFYEDEIKAGHFQPISTTCSGTRPMRRCARPSGSRPSCAISVSSIIGAPTAGRRTINADREPQNWLMNHRRAALLAARQDQQEQRQGP